MGSSFDRSSVLCQLSVGADSAQLSEHARAQLLAIIKALLEKLSVLPSHPNRASHRVITAAANAGAASSSASSADAGTAHLSDAPEHGLAASYNPFSLQIQALVRRRNPSLAPPPLPLSCFCVRVCAGITEQ